MSVLRILQLVHVPRNPDGGSAGVTLKLAEEWRRQGHDVMDVYSDELSKIANRRVREEHLAVAAAVLGLQLSHRVDVIYVTGHLGWILMPLLRRRARRPLLVACSFGLEHTDKSSRLSSVDYSGVSGHVSSRLSGITRLPEVRKTIKHSDMFVGLMQSTCEEVVAAGWKRVDECHVSGCGVPDECWAFRRPPKKPWAGKILWCGTTVERKGWAYFAEAMERLAGRDSIEVHVLGSGPPDPGASSKDLSAQWGCEVFVYPQLDRSSQAAIAAEADVFVSTSLYEGFHRALLEAMAVGMPCVATGTGFIQDAQEPALLASLVPPRDSNAVAEAIHQLAKDETRRSQLAVAGQQFASRFRWDELAEAQVNRFEESIWKRQIR